MRTNTTVTRTRTHTHAATSYSPNTSPALFLYPAAHSAQTTCVEFLSDKPAALGDTIKGKRHCAHTERLYLDNRLLL
jgi:hypothetical protein